MLTIDEAIHYLRSRPEQAALVRDAYLGPDVADSATRFAASTEFAEVLRMVGHVVPGGTVVDLGAGIGIAASAFVDHGAKKVYAIEPDASAEVGRGALARTAAGRPIEIIDALADDIPVATGSVDLVYARQVLHHIPDLDVALRECARILRPGGLFLACREHVVDDAAQLTQFLAEHPVHQLAGGENAYPLGEYLGAIQRSGLRIDAVVAPWSSVINAYPTVRSDAERRDLPRNRLAARLGRLAPLAAVAVHVPGVRQLLWRRIARPTAGRMYSFMAHK